MDYCKVTHLTSLFYTILLLQDVETNIFYKVGCPNINLNMTCKSTQCYNDGLPCFLENYASTAAATHVGLNASHIISCGSVGANFNLSNFVGTWFRKKDNKERVITTANGNYVVVEHTTTKSDALFHCKLMGGHLVAFETQAEYDFFSPFVTSGSIYWIGAKTVNVLGIGNASKGNFMWEHSGARLNETFSQWWGSQPDNFQGSEDCVIMTENGFNDAQCNFSHCDKFICECS